MMQSKQPQTTENQAQSLQKQRRMKRQQERTVKSAVDILLEAMSSPEETLEWRLERSISELSHYGVLGAAMAKIQQGGAARSYYVRCPFHEDLHPLFVLCTGKFPMELKDVKNGKTGSWATLRVLNDASKCMKSCSSHLQVTAAEPVPWQRWLISAWTSAAATLPALGNGEDPQMAFLFLMNLCVIRGAGNRWGWQDLKNRQSPGEKLRSECSSGTKPYPVSHDRLSRAIKGESRDIREVMPYGFF
jgi:hypothetical protein